MTKPFFLPRLASGLLVAALCAASGCLIPQDDTYLTGLAEARNRPPRIVETQVQPSNRIQTLGAGRCEEDFSVVVEDLDVDDLITVRWYVDYDAQTNPTGPFREFQLANNGQALRGDQATLHVNLSAANNPLSKPGTHLVEAVVSDTRLLGRNPAPVEVIKFPDGGSIENPGYVVTYAWFVTTVQGDCQ